METVSIYSQTPEMALKNAGYVINDIAGVLSYIKDDIELLNVLLQIPVVALHYFSETCRLTIYILNDPDSADYEQLVIRIGSQSTPSQLFASLKQMKLEWAMYIDPNIMRKLTLGIESLQST